MKSKVRCRGREMQRCRYVKASAYTTLLIVELVDVFGAKETAVLR